MDTSDLIALHGHFLAADLVKQFMLAEVPVDERTPAQLLALKDLIQFESSALRLQVYYALLYVVVEGYRELKCEDETVDRLLAEADYVDSLRRFRNAVFHFQPEPISPKLTAFLKSEGSEDWTYNLFRALDAFFEAQPQIKAFLDSLESPESAAEMQHPRPPSGSVEPA